MRYLTPFLSITLCLFALVMAQDDTRGYHSSQPVSKQEPVLQTDQIIIPRLISYQGKLTDTLGVPVPNGNYSLTFRLYTQEIGGTPFWSEAQIVPVQNGLFSVLLGAAIPIPSIPDGGALYLSMQVGAGSELTPRLRIGSVPYAYLTERTANADALQGKDTTALDSRYVNEGQANAVTSTMIQDGTILRTDVAANFKAPYADTADYARAAPATDSARVAANSYRWNNNLWGAVDYPKADRADTALYVAGANVVGEVAYANRADTAVVVTGTIAFADSARSAANSHKLQGKDTNALSAKFVDEGQNAGGDLTGAYPNPTIANNAVTSDKILDGTIGAADLNQMGAATGQVLKWTGSAWTPRNDSVGQGDNAWVRDTPDSVLYTIRQLGIARGGAGNMLYGSRRYTHTNLGGACTTGTNGQHYYYCTVAGGYANAAGGGYATVAGGYANAAGGGYATVAGGYYNTAGGSIATVAGGYYNTASGSFATVAGGQQNIASGHYATVGGGYSGIALAIYSGVFSGYQNKAGYNATDTGAVVGGGCFNHASAQYTTVSGGYGNIASGSYATVAGGDRNTAGSYATVGGGYADTARALFSGVLSGYSNLAGDGVEDTAAVVCGGKDNSAIGNFAFVGGGNLNLASNNYATVSGGKGDTASGYAATVAGGQHNIASGSFATVAGGYSNTASGYAATVPGGYFNNATGHYSFAAGTYARANHPNSFVWSDSGSSSSDSVYTTGVNQWRVRARGGVWFFSNRAMTSGVYLAPGSNSWASACDSANKTDFQPVDHKALLKKLATVPVRYYRMKDQNDGTRHLGPVAQDFKNAFGIGESDRAINMADADGVLFAAIQALYEENQQLLHRIEVLEAQLNQGR